MSNDFSIADIKSRIAKDKNGISNYVHVSIEEMDWCVEQAEKVQQYEKVLKEIAAYGGKDMIGKTCAKVAKEALDKQHSK